MDMTGDYLIKASRQAVWDALNDPDVLKQCIPGCEELEKTSDSGFTAKVAAKVGPVKARFTGAVTLSDLDPPNGYKISGEGKGGAAGFAKGGAEVKLSDAEDGATTLSYVVDAQVGGKLAQIGSRLIDSTAKKMAGEFFQTFGALVEAGASNDDAPATPTAAETSDAAPAPASEPQSTKTESSAEQGDLNMANQPNVEENVYPGTHWSVWLIGAISLGSLVLFAMNLG
ncbi:MAG: carbon monoxide dehydrogenase subunit G [Alphaproteobacteria bacterium]|nr:carbon monoxide dehydrogenase subunit G [Alphaproteobacteria bacterium]